MKYIHPETGKTHEDTFIAFSVYTDRGLDSEQDLGYSRLACYHEDYAIAKAAFEKEVAEYQSDKYNHRAKRVTMIYNTRSRFLAQGLIVHSYKVY